jgi:hypothetical protein
MSMLNPLFASMPVPAKLEMHSMTPHFKKSLRFFPFMANLPSFWSFETVVHP